MRHLLGGMVFSLTVISGAMAQHTGPSGGTIVGVAPVRSAAPPVVQGASRPVAPVHTAQAAHTGARTNPTSARTPGAAQRPVNSPASNRASSTNGSKRPGTQTAKDEYGSQYISDQTNVPGLGFDYVHFAAVHPNEVKNRSNHGYVWPFLGGGIYVPGSYYEEQQAAPQASAENQGAETAEGTESAAESETPAAVDSEHHRAPSPEQTAEYVFVRRDGTVFFAVAYSWSAGNLQYVTKEGFSHSIPQNSLDLDATKQFNEQRGTTLHSPV